MVVFFVRQPERQTFSYGTSCPNFPGGGEADGLVDGNGGLIGHGLRVTPCWLCGRVSSVAWLPIFELRCALPIQKRA